MWLSYSAADEIVSCEQKWVFKKVLKVEVDPDANVDTLAFRFGKAFHWLHEVTEHEIGYFEDKADELVAKACVDFQLNEDSACYLMSTVTASLTLWRKTGLRVIKCEIEIKDEKFVGYVDFVAVCPNSGKWWIGDLKTTSMTSNISARLTRDPQLSLYSARRQQIADMLNIDVNLFQGALYRETVKPKIVIAMIKAPKKKLKKGEVSVETTEVHDRKETPREFTSRCMADTQMYIIPVADIVDHQLMVHDILHDRAMALQAGGTPIRNYKNCMAYNKKCDYFSRCYGRLGSDIDNYMLENTMYLVRENSKSGAFNIKSFSLVSDYVQPTQQQQTSVDMSNLGDFL
jgi:hypothetical protein